ncbi:MAG: hypothetical protein IH859_00355 [Chloroflexi bacterium]|nr:hypothetical protein [Chloroflexota bacterium]
MNYRRIILWMGFGFIAMSTSACGAIAGLFATETPLPTNTPLPTATPIQTPTPLPTATPEATAAEAAQAFCSLAPLSSLPEELLEADAAVFTDTEGGYEIAFAENWVQVDLTEGDLSAILSETVAQFPELEEMIETFLGQVDGSGLRVLAIYADVEFTSNVIVPNMNVLLISDPLAAILPLDLLTSQTALSMPQLVPGIEVIGTGLVENALGVPIGLICSRIDLTGAGAVTFQKQAIAKTGIGLLVITFIGANEQREQLEALFDAVIHTFKLVAASSGEDE